uniref:Nematode cuticle collagen N-terminal domain-containing protein n=1 Tax=Romanomermis culicivorax TaxID=13658 RepID=A0A915L8A5_ROMCU
MSIKAATWLAASLSLFVLITCAVVVPMIYSEIQNIWDELDMEIGEFK